jgi:hypothetical protein
MLTFFGNHHFHPPTDLTDSRCGLGMGMEFGLTDCHSDLHSPPFMPPPHVYPATYNFPLKSMTVGVMQTPPPNTRSFYHVSRLTDRDTAVRGSGRHLASFRSIERHHGRGLCSREEKGAVVMANGGVCCARGLSS